MIFDCHQYQTHDLSRQQLGVPSDKDWPTGTLLPRVIPKPVGMTERERCGFAKSNYRLGNSQSDHSPEHAAQWRPLLPLLCFEQVVDQARRVSILPDAQWLQLSCSAGAKPAA